jgi:hypothetical protein
LATQYWITGTSGDWSTGVDWLSGVSPTSTDDAVIDSSTGVTVNGTAVAYSLTLNDFSRLSVSGTLTLGTSLTVDGGARLTLSGGTLSAQSITSDDTSGLLFGYGTVSGAVKGYVTIYADGGTLKIQGSLAGDQGPFVIESGATLELSNGTAGPIWFSDNLGTLKLDAPTTFTGSLGNIVVGDTIDLDGITASSATYSGSTLTINETNGQHLTYNVINGGVAGNTVMVASDNNGGTLVYWVQPPESWITGRLGDWSTGADWLSGVAPSSTDDAVINNSTAVQAGSTAVTVNGTAVAHSLALNDSNLTVSGTLTLGTSLTVDGNAELKLSGGTLSAQSVTTDSGTFGSVFGYGTVSVSGPLSGNVGIYADGGTLKVQGSLAGDQGVCSIDPGATLELSSGTAALVSFGYNNLGTLKLDAPTVFTGPISDIAVGDTIDLAGITASSATYSGSTLTINETNGQHLTYNVSGSVAGDTVTVASDNNGGTLVYWMQSPAAPSIAINAVDGTNDINKAEAVAGFAISGTESGADGQTVTVKIVNGSNQIVDSYTTTAASGVWTANVTSTQAQALANGSYTVKADVSDAAGNPATEATQVFTVDTVMPSVTEALVHDTGSSSSDKITSNPALTGSGDPNAVVHFTWTATRLRPRPRRVAAEPGRSHRAA